MADTTPILPVDSKTEYEEAGRVHRYFLTWRQGMLAGYLASYYIILSKAFELCQAHEPKQTGLLLAAAGCLGLILLVGDIRARELYGHASRAAQRLAPNNDPAQDLAHPDPHASLSLYQRMNLKPSWKPTGGLGPHSLTIAITYIAGSIALFVPAIVLLATNCHCR